MAFFKHDCDRCEFLGSVILDKKYDLYFCGSTEGEVTVIARYGDDGPDYQSGLNFSSVIEPIAIARKLAEMRGLIPSLPWGEDISLLKDVMRMRELVKDCNY